eukprot:scaffold4454_cov411-Prasinococcus_capsulatus_cf.AAC.13
MIRNFTSTGCCGVRAHVARTREPSSMSTGCALCLTVLDISTRQAAILKGFGIKSVEYIVPDPSSVAAEPSSASVVYCCGATQACCAPASDSGASRTPSRRLLRDDAVALPPSAVLARALILERTSQ